MVRGEAAVLKRIALLAALLTAMLLLAPLAPLPRSDLEFRLLAYSSHAAFYVGLSLLVAHLAPLWRLGMRQLLSILLGLFALVMLLNVLDVDVASDIAKVAFGTIAGLAFVRALERLWWLAPICICVPIADAWSVFSERGVTNAVVDRAREDPTWIEWPTIATPIAGFPYESFGRIGIVDVLFLALFLGAAVRWRIGVWRGVAACSLGFLATSVLVFEGVAAAVPALPLLCLAFLIAYGPALWRDMRAAFAGN